MNSSPIKYTFTHECTYERQPHTKVTLETDAICLSELLREIASFLRACGFSINGDLEIVKEDDQ